MNINWEFLTWLVAKYAPYLKRLIGRGALPRDSWVPRLNDLFRGEVELFGPYRHEPQIHLEGCFPLNATQAELAAKERKRLATDPNKSNDPHAVLSAEPNWADDPLHFHALSLDFAAVRILRSVTPCDNPRPPVLSANVLLICRESREVILHRRAPDSDTFPNALHTIGGAYWPPGFDGREGDRFSLRRTAVREAGEEGDAAFAIDKNQPMIVMREGHTGFVQLAFLGVNISLAEAQNLNPNREGTIDHVSYDDLPHRLRREREWVPTGKAAILAWLALGAPNGGWLAKFGGIKPVKLFAQEVGATNV